MERIHKSKYKELTQSSSSKTQQKITKFTSTNKTILNHCINIAISGKPFVLFDDPDMRSLTNIALEAKGDITAKSVRKGVREKATEVREEIKSKIKGHQISVSADFASCNGKEFFGE